MWVDLSKWAKDVRTLVSPVNAHQKVTSADEEFSNQVDRMIRSVDSQPLPPAIPVSVQWGHEQSGHVAEMGVMLVLGCTDLHSPKWCGCSYGSVPDLPTAVTNT